MPRWYIDGCCLRCGDEEWSEDFRDQQAELKFHRWGSHGDWVPDAFYPKDGTDATIGTWPRRDALAGRFDVDGASDTSSTVSYAPTTILKSSTLVVNTYPGDSDASTAGSDLSTSCSDVPPIDSDSEMWSD